MREWSEAHSSWRDAPCTVIFAHSMGNLILAGALDRGLCELSSQTWWFAIGAPWLGTASADSIPELCRHPDVANHIHDQQPPPGRPQSRPPQPPPPSIPPPKLSGPEPRIDSAESETPQRSHASESPSPHPPPRHHPPSPPPPATPPPSSPSAMPPPPAPPPPDLPLAPVLRELARREGYCEGAGGTASPAYASLSTRNPSISRAARWRARVNGSMCGTSAFGLWSIYSLEMQALEQWVGFGQPNDGVVPAASCAAPDGAEAGSIPTMSQYTAGVNHYDLTCRNGDGWWGDDRRPCAWYLARASEAAAAAGLGMYG